MIGVLIMLGITTDRLKMIPLKAENLGLLIKDQKQLESNLSLNESSSILSQELSKLWKLDFQRF